MVNKELEYSFDILKKVYFDNAYIGIELNKVLQMNQTNLNQSLITKIVYGVVESDIYLSYVVEHFAKRTPKPSFALLLKICVYAKDNINSIPPFALVNELVELAKKEDRHISGFVNATCKNIINTKVELPDKNKNYPYFLSIKYNYPEWIIKELLKVNTREFVEQLVSTKLTTLTHIRIVGGNGENGKQIVSDFIKLLNDKNIEFKPAQLPYSMYVDYQKLLKDKDFDGKYLVQGLPSIVACLALDVKRGSVLDCCSAPGGKTAFLAELNKDVQVTACDLHSHRLLLIKNYVNKLKLANVTYAKQDATILNSNWINQFDYVLCDVPCSGIGVVNKKPDILLNRTLADVQTLSGIQYAILNNNAKYVKEGGVLVYSTCTILPQENDDIIKKFLKNNPQFKCAEINTQSIPVIEKNNCYTFYPNVSGTEGFFITRLIKNKEVKK